MVIEKHILLSTGTYHLVHLKFIIILYIVVVFAIYLLVLLILVIISSDIIINIIVRIIIMKIVKIWESVILLLKRIRLILGIMRWVYVLLVVNVFLVFLSAVLH